MSRLLFLLAAGAVIYLLIKSYGDRPRGDTPPASGNANYAEDMVRCIQCGVHLPRSESIMSGGKFYCCEAHRLAHQSQSAERDAR